MFSPNIIVSSKYQYNSQYKPQANFYVRKYQMNGGGALEKEKWVLCPICNNKTRIKVRPDTVLENFPLYCPKCKQETIINVNGQNVVAIKSSESK